MSRHRRDQDFIRFAMIDADRPTRVRRQRPSSDAGGLALIMAVVIPVVTFALVAILGHR